MKINFKSKYNLAKYISSTFGYIFKNNNYKCLLYHSIGFDYDNDKIKIYNLPKNIFKEQMLILKNLKYEVSNNINDNLSNKNRITITFDDGLLSIYENALEILEELNIPFIIFVSPELIRSNQNIYMNEKQIKELSLSNLCTIGSHGFAHKDFTSYNLDELVNLEKKSKYYLEDLIGKKVKYLSYPFGKYNIKIDKCMKELNYDYTFTSEFGSNKSGSNILKRIDIWNYDNKKQFIMKLKGQWDWLSYYK